MDIKSLKKIIESTQSTFPVECWVIDSLPAWPIIRHLIFENFENKNSTSRSPFNKVNELRFFDLVVKKKSQFYSLLKCLYFLFKKKNFLAFSKVHLRAEVNGISYNRFIDPLRFENPDSFYLFESKSDELSGKSLFLPKQTILMTGLGLIFKIVPIGLINKMEKKRCFNSVEKYDEFLKSLPSNLAGKLSINRVNSVFRSLKKQIFFFRIVFKISKPKTIYFNVYYALDFFPIIYAARSLGIQVIEIQHGVASSLHPSYAFIGKISEDGLLFYPNKYLFWSSYEKTHFELNQIGESEISGNLWLSLWKKISIKKNETLQSFKSDKRIILFTLQWNNIPDYIIPFLEKCPSNNLILIRCHPSQVRYIKQFEEELNTYVSNGRVELYFASTLPLFEVLEVCDLHITETSSVIIEASYFNIKSLAIDPIASEKYPDQIESGMLQILSMNDFKNFRNI